MKIIYRTFIVIFLFFFITIIYLSTIGIETTRFNNKIESIIQNFDKDTKIELKKVRISLDPIELKINVKTVGPKLKLKNKIIELEYIQTQVILNSFFTNNFSIKNLSISSKSIEIEKFIYFIRNFKNTPELYILEKILKKGYLICDINLEFDNKGKIKDNYSIIGSVKDTQIKFLEKYDLDPINLSFNITKNFYEITNIKFNLNNSQFSSEKILIKENRKNFTVEGLIENKKIELKDKLLSSLLKKYFPRIKFIDANLNLKNKFSLNINKKLSIDNLKLDTKIEINSFKIKNNFALNNFFPNVNKEINFTKNSIILKYEKDKLSIVGEGKILLQNKEDYIKYDITKNDKIFNFKTNLSIDKNPITIKILGYEKSLNNKATLRINGNYDSDNKITIKSFSYNEDKNVFKIDDLIFDKTFKIQGFKNVNFEYFDKDQKENEVRIFKKNRSYNVVGSKFNVNNIIDNFLKASSDDAKFLNNSINFVIKIDQVYLDNEYFIQNLNGSLNFKRNEIFSAELNGSFSQNKNLKFTVKTNDLEKVTTLFLDQAEPIIKRYKFIKGYKGGSLDFYSTRKKDISYSNLKIYNFKLKELPILTKILTLASLQGIADILSGEGITFDEFEMNFENQKNLIKINELYAIGPAISILMDGYVEKNKLISLRGSLVPATTINKAIGNIPVLGKILVGAKTGEGVFGVSFKIKGPPENLETSVNPIKTLTPRFITRTLEKIKKTK